DGFLRRCPCWPGPYSRRLRGLFARPQRLTPRRRLILYFDSSRLLISAGSALGCCCPNRAIRRTNARRPGRIAHVLGKGVHYSQRPGEVKPAAPLVRSQISVGGTRPPDRSLVRGGAR